MRDEELLENDQKHLDALNDYTIQLENQKESLLAENERLRTKLKSVAAERDEMKKTLDMYGGEEGITAAFAERDALLAYAPRECNTCKYWHCPGGRSWCDAPGADPCNVGKRQLWEWRGMEDAE